MYRVDLVSPQPDFALHVATEGALARRQPTGPLPDGSLAVFPSHHLPAGTPGALLLELLALGGRERTSRFFTDAALDSSNLTGWRWCSETGLTIPYHLLHEISFDRTSGISAVRLPKLTGHKFDDDVVTTVAWFALFTAPTETVAATLADVALRLDIEGPRGDTAAALADLLAERWHAGRGAVQASKCGDVWINPRCLRWLVREIAAYSSYAADGHGDGRVATSEHRLLAAELFPHLGLFGDGPEREADIADVAMAAWLLHYDYSGFGVGGGPRPFDALAALTAVGAAPASKFESLVRLAAWARIWQIPDDHPVRLESGWNRHLPSDLRSAFTDATGLTVEAWFATLSETVLRSLLGVATNRNVMFDLAGVVPPGLEAAVQRVFDEQLADGLIEHGAAERADSKSYSGLGTLDQAEVSPLNRRPLLRLGSTYMPASVDALVSAGIKVVQDAAERSLNVGTRQLNGTIGRMYEAHCADLVDSLDRQRQVVVTHRDLKMHHNGQSGDAVVATDSAAAVLEFSMQTPSVAATRGSVEDINRTLGRYLKKNGQARATPHLELVGARLGHLHVGHFVVVNDPLSMNPVTVSTLTELGGESAQPFVVSVVDLQILVNLTTVGHDFAAALIAWQNTTPARPFASHLHQMEALTQPTWAEDALATIRSLYAIALEQHQPPPE